MGFRPINVNWLRVTTVKKRGPRTEESPLKSEMLIKSHNEPVIVSALIKEHATCKLIPMTTTQTIIFYSRLHHFFLSVLNLEKVMREGGRVVKCIDLEY